jgi:site-specific recombinase XerD
VRKKEKTKLSREGEDLLGCFKEALMAFGKAETTIELYARILTQYLELNSEPEPFQRENVLSFLSVKRREGCRGNTLRLNYYALKTFFTTFQKPWPFDKSEVPERSETYTPFFTPEEMAKMEASARAMGPRYYALVRLENAIGLRRTEIRCLNVDDYRKPKLRVQTAKHGEYVERELDPTTCDALDEYLGGRGRLRRVADANAMFVRGLRGPRLSLRGLNDIYKRIRDRAGIDKERASFHAARRGRITDLYERGMKEAELTKEWGWRSDQTVKTYVKLSKKHVEEKLRSIHPYFNEEK